MQYFILDAQEQTGIAPLPNCTFYKSICHNVGKNLTSDAQRLHPKQGDGS